MSDNDLRPVFTERTAAIVHPGLAMTPVPATPRRALSADDLALLRDGLGQYDMDIRWLAHLDAANVLRLWRSWTGHQIYQATVLIDAIDANGQLTDLLVEQDQSRYQGALDHEPALFNRILDGLLHTLRDFRAGGTSSGMMIVMDEPGQLDFRYATDSDVPAIVELVESAYRGETSRAGWTTEADILHGQRTDREAVSATLSDPRSRIVLAELDGELVACCQLERCDPHAHFGMFAVRPDRQGSGVGKKVMAEAERIASVDWGAREMRMTVISVRDELVSWYVRRGYQRTGTTSAFPYGDERFGIPQRPGLEFELLIKPLP